MKLMHLILSVAACCNVLSLAEAQDNYSLWPQRPEELEQARELMSAQKWSEAASLLRPFVCDSGVSGSEARSLVGRLNVARYLSRMHPHSAVYVVKRGDTLPKIAAVTKCPVDLIMLYNGLVAPSNLKVGQKLVVVQMNLRVEVYLPLNEITVWDDDILVASYRIVSHKGGAGKEKGSEDSVVSREFYAQGKKVPAASTHAASADKLLRLSEGCIIAGPAVHGNQVICLEQKDVNELALLVRETNTVLWKSDLSGDK